MEPTRRVWIVFAVAGSGAVLAAVFSNPLFFIIPIGTGMWTLAQQLAFARAVRQIGRLDPPVGRQSLADKSIRVGDSTTLRVEFSAERSIASLVPVVELAIPPSLRDDTAQTHPLPMDDTPVVTAQIQPPAAGSVTIGRPRLRLSSSHGLFQERLDVANACSLTVEPRVVQLRHRRSEERQTESGETAATDPVWTQPPAVHRADGSPPARTHLFIDRRADLRGGTPGQTPLDCVRDVGLALTERAATNEEPLQVSILDDDHDPTFSADSPEEYDHIRQQLFDLTPADSRPRPADFEATDRSMATRTRSTERAHHDPLRVRRRAVKRARTLDRDKTDAFARTLGPYFETMATYTHNVTTSPLFDRVSAAIDAQGGNTWFVLITDDSCCEEIRGVARLASVHGVDLSIVVVPSRRCVDRDSATVDAVVDEHAAFQSLIRELNQIAGVTAVAAGPHGQLTGDSAASTQDISS